MILKWIVRKILVVSLVFLIFLFVITLLYMMGSLPYQKVIQILGTSLGSLAVSNPLLFSGILFILMLFVSVALKKLRI